MAFKQQSQTKKPSPGLETQGPVMADLGNDPVTLPPNPSDQIFEGRALPIRGPQATTGRRDFSIPVKPTLHYRDGLDGAAETVTVNERRFNQNTEAGEGEAEQPPYASGMDWDHDEFGAAPGTDKNKYSKGANPEYTENGQWIRGT